MCLLEAPLALGAHRHKPCSIPGGWRLVAKDGQGRVDAPRHQPLRPVYDYCNRVGRTGWRRLVKGPDTRPAPSFSFLLAGRYVAYTLQLPAGTSSTMSLWDTRNGQNNTMYVGGNVSNPVQAFLLSPHGVAAAITVSQQSEVDTFPGASVEALTLNSSGPVTVTSSPPSDIANLELYDCAAGCAPDTVIVAWTQSGAQQYAQVQGSS
jgi:hypothetical protein